MPIYIHIRSSGISQQTRLNCQRVGARNYKFSQMCVDVCFCSRTTLAFDCKKRGWSLECRGGSRKRIEKTSKGWPVLKMFPNETIMTQNLGRTNLTMIFNPSEKRINVVKTIINHPSVITYCKNYSEMGRLWHCFTHIIHPQHKLISQTDVHHMIRSKFEWKKTGLGKCHFFWTLQSPTESSSCDVQNPEKQYLRSS